jgi:hypothetical protein
MQPPRGLGRTRCGSRRVQQQTGMELDVEEQPQFRSAAAWQKRRRQLRDHDLQPQPADGVFTDNGGRPDLLDLAAFGRVKPDGPHRAPNGRRMRRHPVLPR